MKRVLSLILTVIMLSSVMISAHAENAPFTDVKVTAWYAEAVSTVYENGIMEGKAEGKFAPSASMTRAELVTVLCRLSGDNAAGKGSTLTFNDTKKTAWYADSVAWAVETGVVGGYADNTFKPNKPVLRQELAKMFVGFLEYMSLPLEGEVLIDSFSDSTAFPKWAAEYIETLRKTGLMGGDTAGNFKPKADASRAEIATVITRLLPRMDVDVPEYVVENSVSNYVFVYDDTDPQMSSYITELIYKVRVQHGINAKFVAASRAETTYEYEFVIGAVRPCAQRVYASLDPTGDFAVTYLGDDIVAVANDPIYYPYLFAVIEMEILSKYTEGNLKLTPDFGIVYKQSDIKDLNYAEYLAHKKAYMWNYIDGLFSAESYSAKDGTVLNYRIYVPSDYDPAKEYPVVVFLHGAGERGSDNKSQLSNMITTMMRIDGTPFVDAIIVSPQCPQDNQWVDTPWADGSYSTAEVSESNELKAVVELLGEIGERYSTDRDRYYAMGLSMGGFGTWDLIMRHTELFAAAVPICGGADPSMAEKLRDLPIYTVHGDIDPTVPVTGTREMVEALREAGSDVIYEELEDYTHNVWDYVASRKHIIEWLFEQRLSDRK